MSGFFIDAKTPTITPKAKLPKIINTLDIYNFQNRNFTSVTSTFWIENITITVANKIANTVLSFIRYFFIILDLSVNPLTSIFGFP